MTILDFYFNDFLFSNHSHKVPKATILIKSLNLVKRVQVELPCDFFFVQSRIMLKSNTKGTNLYTKIYTTHGR